MSQVTKSSISQDRSIDKGHVCNFQFNNSYAIFPETLEMVVLQSWERDGFRSTVMTTTKKILSTSDSSPQGKARLNKIIESECILVAQIYPKISFKNK